MSSTTASHHGDSPKPGPPLPLDVFLLIKEVIPQDDLRTHVYFYLSDPQLAAMYDNQEDPDKLWRLACWFCGIGRLRTDGDSRCAGFWRDLAIQLVMREGHCMHPRCGEALLQYNRAFEILPRQLC